MKYAINISRWFKIPKYYTEGKVIFLGIMSGGEYVRGIVSVHLAARVQNYVQTRPNKFRRSTCLHGRNQV